MAKTWGDIYWSHLRRGEDHGWAAHMADNWQRKHQPETYAAMRQRGIEMQIPYAWKAQLSREKQAVKSLGDGIGYGNMMHLAQECWRESLAVSGFPDGGEFQYGPCVAMTVPCGCKSRKDCDWCCGSGWLTKHVKAVKDKTGE